MEQREKVARNGDCNAPLEDYWQECNSFDDGIQTFDDEDDMSKTPDEGEAEEEWLREAGFQNLVDSDPADPSQTEAFADMLSTLTARQIAVVKRRLDTVQMSKKKRLPRSSRHRADVRDLFGKDLSSIPPESLPTIPSEPHSLSFPVDGLNLSSSVPVGVRWSTKSSTPTVRSNDEPFSFPQQHHHSKSNSRALPLPFLRTSHSGGFSLSEHTKAIDCESPTSVEVLRYETRNSVMNDEEAFTRFSDFDSINSSDTVPLETGFQEIASRINSINDIADSDKDSASLQRHSNVQVGDMSETDRNLVRSLAIIEVAAALDTHGLVPTRRRKPNRKKGKDSVVFGASINTLLELDRKRSLNSSGHKIPLIYQWIFHHLHSNGLREEGLLRLAGSVHKIQSLKSDIEKLYASSPSVVENLIRQSSAIDISVLLKQLIRHLPEPLLTNSHMDAFLQVPNIPNVSDQTNILNLLILALPDGHRELLQELLYFLSKVVDDEEANRMSLNNVAMIMAPNLFPPPRLKKGNLKNNDLATEVTVAAMSSKVTQLLIKYNNFLGAVPPELLAQARLQNQRMSNKSGKRGGRKHKGDKQKNAKDDSHSSSIRVQVPSLRHPSSLVVPISDRTTAGDVVENVADALEYMMDPRNQNRVAGGEQQENRAFLLRPRTTSEPIVLRHRCLWGSKKTDCLKDHFLYFIRENVGERRLDHGINVLTIASNNSGRFASGSAWEIRCHH